MQVLLYHGQDPGGGFRDDTYYAETAAQDIGITVSGLNPDMAYDVTVYRVDETHGNAWGIWDSQGRPTMSAMTTENWDALRAGMESAPESVATAVCGDTFSQTFALASPGALLLTIGLGVLMLFVALSYLRLVRQVEIEVTSGDAASLPEARLINS